MVTLLVWLTDGKKAVEKKNPAVIRSGNGSVRRSITDFQETSILSEPVSITFTDTNPSRVEFPACFFIFAYRPQNILPYYGHIGPLYIFLLGYSEERLKIIIEMKYESPSVGR